MSCAADLICMAYQGKNLHNEKRITQHIAQKNNDGRLTTCC